MRFLVAVVLGSVGLVLLIAGVRGNFGGLIDVLTATGAPAGAAPRSSGTAPAPSGPGSLAPPNRGGARGI